MTKPTKICARLSAAKVDLASSIYQRTPNNADAYLFEALDFCCGPRNDLYLLEVGTCRGVSSAILATRGQVLTIDRDTRHGVGDALKALDTEARVVRMIGAPELVRPLVRGKFDACFIDATHNYENVMRDFGFAVLHTNNVIFHDYCEDHNGVIAAVDEIHKMHGGELRIFDCFAALRLEAFS